jgi:hypothetical protein
MRAAYRARQFLRAATARKDPSGLDEVRRLLPPQAMQLFEAMPLHDQRHSLAVYDALRARGQTHPALLQAALLHDSAKAGVVRLWHRVAIVLLNALAPGIGARLGLQNPRSWRYPFYVSRHHAELGADRAAQAGVDPLAVELIRSHSVHGSNRGPGVPGELLAALQAVDDQN